MHVVFLLTVCLIQVGLGICYDLRFPELSVALQRHGAEILTYPSAFTVATGAAHWEVSWLIIGQLDCCEV